MCLAFRPLVILLPALLLALPAVGAGCAATSQDVEVWGFTGPWDPRSDASVRDHGGRLDAVVSGWIALDSLTGQPILPPLFADTVRPVAGSPARLALVTSWHGDRFHASSIRALGRDADALRRAAGSLGRLAAGNGYDGLVFDFETLERRDLDTQLRVLRVMADSARARGVGIIVAAVPATDTAAYPAEPLLAVADALVVMLYDQHWSGSEPGPIAEPRWLRRSLALRVAEAGPDRLIAALPLYGYRWPTGGPGVPVSFEEARAEATRAGTPLRRDPESRTLRASTRDGTEIWVTDAELLRLLMDDVRDAGVHRFALWRLGQEDPAIWTLPMATQGASQGLSSMATGSQRNIRSSHRLRFDMSAGAAAR